MGPAPAMRIELPGCDVRLAHRGDGHGQRLEQRGRLVGHGIRYWMGEFGVDGDVAAERAVDRRGGVELHVGAQVVTPRGALLAAPARMLRLDGDPLADPGRVDLLAHRRDAPRQLVAEDHRLFDDEVTDPPVPVVMHVGSADADRRDLDEDLVWSRRRDRPVLDLQRADAGHHAGPHRGGIGGHIASLRSVEVSRARPTTICWTPAAAHSGAISSVTPPSTATGNSENLVVQAVTRRSRSRRATVAGAGFDEHHQDAVRLGRAIAGHRCRPIPAIPRSRPSRRTRGWHRPVRR